MATAAFDRIAHVYDQLWTDAPAGRRQRDAVWRNLTGCFRPGDSVLDLGCGTGEDAAWLQAQGVQVTAIDTSIRMVHAARRRGIDARCLPMERVDAIKGRFDGAISNFGPLNCVDEPGRVCEALASKIKPGGHLAICVMGRFCLWETVAYLLSGRFKKAVRRWSGSAAAESLGIRVTYHTVRSLRRAFEPEFSLIRVAGIGIAVSPSFVPSMPAPLMHLAGDVDRAIERVPLIRALADHRLLIFVRK